MDSPFYVGLIVVDKERKKILLGKRREDGLWTGPGGGADSGENPKQTAIREGFEECNLQLKPRDLKELPSVPLENGKVCHCFLVTVDSKKLKNLHVGNDPDREVREWNWYNLDEPLPGKTDSNRLTSINNAKMKILGLKKAEEELYNTLMKSKGEGSRGGKVVGHTASGEPIYESQKRRIAGKLTADDQWKIHSTMHARDSEKGEHGHSCDHCGKGIKRLVQMNHPEHGMVTVGEDCAEALAEGSAQQTLKEKVKARKDGEKQDKASASFIISRFDLSKKYPHLDKKALSEKVLEAVRNRVKDSKERGEPSYMRAPASLADYFKDHLDQLEEKLNKAIVSNPQAEIDINTAESSIEEIAAGNDPWIEILEEAAKNLELGEGPAEVTLPDCRTLILNKIDDGIYTGFIKDTDENSGSFGEILSRLEKMSPVSMVQAMKVKGYLPRESPFPEAAPEVLTPALIPDVESLYHMLNQQRTGDLHIHIHKSEDLRDLFEALEKGRAPMPVGTDLTPDPCGKL